MRICVDDLHRPEIFKRFRGVKIFVDGVEYKDVIIADQENKYIKKYKLDEKGSFCLNFDRSEILTEKINGNVEFVFKDDENDN